MHEILTVSATELARRVRARELSPVEIVDAHIARIREVNGDLNAVVAERFDAARAEARTAEARALREPDPPPFLGVPCTIKEFVSVDGMPHTAGCVRRRGRVARQDATLVRRLREAGAIVLGVTNAPEGGLWYETDNPLYGRTSNPWDLHRTSGGSSGGEGAIIAAGGSPFGIGSDTGGSIRIPSGFCGIAGHKPTGGLLPATGHYPPAPHGEPVMACGPMARDAVDLWPLMKVLAGPDGEDAQVRAWPLGDPAAVDLGAVRVFPLETNGRVRPEPAVLDGIRRATDALVDRGASIGRLHAHGLERAFEIWATVLTESGASYDDLVGDGRPIAFWRQLLGWPLGRSDHSGAVLLLLALERLTARVPQRLTELPDLAVQLRDELEAQLGPNGVILHPVYPRTAPRHRGMAYQLPWNVACTTLFNITTLPVTVVPVGLDARGMPVSVQIAARRGNDHLTVAVGVALQEAFGRLSPIDPRPGKPAPLGLELVGRAERRGQTFTGT